MLLNICREKVAQRDAAQARVRELEAENRVLRRAHNGPGDLGHYNCAGEFVPPQEWVDAATGRDLRCLMECGLTWCRVNGDDAPEWLVQLDKGEAYTQFPTLAEAASAVRKWQAGHGKPEPAPSPEDAARASDGVYHLKPIEAGPAYNVPVATLKPSPVVIGTSATSRPHQGAAVIVNGEYVDAASVVIDGNSIAINKRFEMVPNPFVELVAKWTAEDAVEDAPPDTQDTPCDAPEAPAEG